MLDALLAEQPCTSERLDSVLQCFLNIDCIALHFTVLRFLLYQLQHKTYHINFALCFIRQHCCSLLQQPPFQPIRDGIFAQALSVTDYYLSMGNLCTCVSWCLIYSSGMLKLFGILLRIVPWWRYCMISVCLPMFGYLRLQQAQ